MERSKKKGFFSVEIESKKQLTNVSISNKPHEQIVIEGFLGEFSEIEMIENALIQFKGANGVMRIDISKEELWQKLRARTEV
ncbi:hypothetical protein ISS40_00975 [Candidatus Bathyarchaeota archaeon]|nr:hypothetical protein [Candidatus Bathyarchaeota archaeon]